MTQEKMRCIIYKLDGAMHKNELLDDEIDEESENNGIENKKERFFPGIIFLFYIVKPKYNQKHRNKKNWSIGEYKNHVPDDSDITERIECKKNRLVELEDLRKHTTKRKQLLKYIK